VVVLITVTSTPHKIEIDGHAGYGPPGYDIVCSAVSTLTQTLIGSMEALTEDKIQYSINPGRVEIYFGNLSDQGRLLIDSFFIGLRGVSSSFPTHLQLT